MVDVVSGFDNRRLDADAYQLRNQVKMAFRGRFLNYVDASDPDAEGDGVRRDDYEAYKFFSAIADSNVTPGSPEAKRYDLIALVHRTPPPVAASIGSSLSRVAVTSLISRTSSTPACAIAESSPCCIL